MNYPRIFMLSINIHFYNFSQERIPDKAFFEKEIRKNIFSFEKKFKKKKRNLSLAVIFLPNDKMRFLNYRWRKKNKVTSVLTFSDLTFKNDFSSEKILGDLFLAPKEIAKFSFQQKKTIKEGYQEVIRHGIANFYLGGENTSQAN